MFNWIPTLGAFYKLTDHERCVHDQILQQYRECQRGERRLYEDIIRALSYRKVPPISGFRYVGTIA